MSGRNEAPAEDAQGEPEEGDASFFELLYEFVLSVAGL